jgi:hypothetical protein
MTSVSYSINGIAHRLVEDAYQSLKNPSRVK